VHYVPRVIAHEPHCGGGGEHVLAVRPIGRVVLPVVGGAGSAHTGGVALLTPACLVGGWMYVLQAAHSLSGHRIAHRDDVKLSWTTFHWTEQCMFY
jgi:hypothetical protein